MSSRNHPGRNFYIGIVVVFGFLAWLSLYSWDGIQWGKAKNFNEIVTSSNRGLQTRDTYPSRRDIALLDTTDEQMLEQSIYAIERNGQDAVPGLLKALTDKKSSLRLKRNTIYALGRLGPGAAKATSSIIPYLRHKDADMRATTAAALGKIKSYESVSALIPLLEDPEPWVQQNAVKALESIGTGEAKMALKRYHASGS